MCLESLRRLSPLLLLAVLAAACSSSREAPGPAEPMPGAEIPRAATAPTETARLDATPVVEAPATRSPENQPYRPAVEEAEAFPPQNWVESLRSTALRSAPTEQAWPFAELPPQSYLKVLEVRLGWLLVVYGGDGRTRAPGNAWVRAADVAPLRSKPKWLKNHRATDLWPSAEATEGSFVRLPQWSFLELVGPERSGRLRVRYPGDGRHRLPGEAWVNSRDVGPVQSPAKGQIPWAYPAVARSDVLRLTVPYRSQLDGRPWAAANCGPAVLGMGLEALGISITSDQLRREVLNTQQVWGDDVGSYIWALAEVAERHGARALDLYQRDGGLKRWSLEDIRSQLNAGRAVIVQVYYRALPGRGESPYNGDHYIVITGLVGDNFLYNDPIDNDGVGYDRLMSGAELHQAMDASDREYAYAGFALGLARR